MIFIWSLRLCSLIFVFFITWKCEHTSGFVLIIIETWIITFQILHVRSNQQVNSQKQQTVNKLGKSEKDRLINTHVSKRLIEFVSERGKGSCGGFGATPWCLLHRLVHGVASLCKSVDAGIGRPSVRSDAVLHCSWQHGYVCSLRHSLTHCFCTTGFFVLGRQLAEIILESGFRAWFWKWRTLDGSRESDKLWCLWLPRWLCMQWFAQLPAQVSNV